jgi:hypothetical protein
LLGEPPPAALEDPARLAPVAHSSEAFHLIGGPDMAPNS